MKARISLRILIAFSAIAFSLTAWGFDGNAPMPPVPHPSGPAFAGGQANFDGWPLPPPVPSGPLQRIGHANFSGSPLPAPVPTIPGSGH